MLKAIDGQQSVGNDTHLAMKRHGPMVTLDLLN